MGGWEWRAICAERNKWSRRREAEDSVDALEEEQEEG